MIGNKYKGFKAIINWRRINKLTCIEREQLLWLSAANGVPIAHDKEYEYYTYKIPFSEWHQKLSLNEVFLKVHKESRKAIHLLTAIPETPDVEYITTEANVAVNHAGTNDIPTSM